MTEKQKVEKAKIKDYWETRLPQTWYSGKKPGTLEWFNELAFQRYNVYYAYLLQVAEFEYHPGERVLEIGVGMGTDLIQYAKNGAKVSGIDLTEDAITKTRQHFITKGLKFEHLQTADAENLPFKDNSFDLVYSFGVLHHTPNTDKAIEEIHRVLKPGGKAIVMLYSRGWKHYFKRVFIHGILMGGFLRKGYNKLISDQTEVLGGSPLTYLYKKKEVKKMFKMFGETDIKRHRLGEYIDYAPYKTRKVPNFIKNLLYLFALDRLAGENYIIKAIKKEKEKRFSFWKTLLKP
jgi:ubiquinone/menaquinone biosynthesis C-methylase UbiE